MKSRNHEYMKSERGLGVSPAQRSDGKRHFVLGIMCRISQRSDESLVSFLWLWKRFYQVAQGRNIGQGSLIIALRASLLG